MSHYTGEADYGSAVDCRERRIDMFGECTELDEVLRPNTEVAEKLCAIICRRQLDIAGLVGNYPHYRCWLQA